MDRAPRRRHAASNGLAALPPFAPRDVDTVAQRRSHSGGSAVASVGDVDSGGGAAGGGAGGGVGGGGGGCVSDGGGDVLHGLMVSVVTLLIDGCTDAILVFARADP